MNQLTGVEVWLVFSGTGGSGWLAGGRTAMHKDVGMLCRGKLPGTSKSSTKWSAASRTWDKSTLSISMDRGPVLLAKRQLHWKWSWRSGEDVKHESAVSCAYWLTLGRVSAGQEKGLFPSTQHSWGHLMDLVSAVLSFASIHKCQRTAASPVEEPLRKLREWRTWHVRRSWAKRSCLAWKRESYSRI